MAGVKPVVLAIIVQALWKLAPPIAKRPALIAVAVAAVAAAILGAHEVIILIGGGLVSVGLGRLGKPNDSDDAGAGNSAAPGAKRPGRRFKPMQLFGVGFLSGLVGAPTVGGVFLYFLYLGCVLYGSGYVLVAFLSRDLLAFGWITRPQLLDAIAIGQVTPGPLFTTATFIGYLVQGVPGSIAATVGIFLPSFIFVLLTHRWIARLRQRRSTALFLDGVNAGAVGLIAVALILLGASTLTTPFTWIVAVASLAVLLPTRVNPMWLIGVGALAGWLVAMLG
jgi:chromate transporter